MTHMKKVNTVLSVIAVSLMVLAACAPAAQQAPAPAPAAPKAPQAPAPAAAPQAPAAAPAPAPAAPAAPAAQEEKPTYGGQLIWVHGRALASLDPLSSTLITAPERISLVYPRLMVYDRKEEEGWGEAKALPSYITESWEFSADGRTLTFHLKKGVKYQNIPPVNGREFVAADVKYSIERYKNHPVSTFKPQYVDIASIEIPDNYTVVFKLKRQSAYVLYALAAEPSFITPPEVEKQYGDYKQVLIGPGPFIHEKTLEQEGSWFHKNPDYVDAVHVYADKFMFKTITDPSTTIAALRAGQLDFGATTSTPSQLNAILKTNPELRYIAALAGNSWVAPRTDKEPFKDLRVRKAISKAIDRDELIGRFLENVGYYTGVLPLGFRKWALSDKEMRDLDAFKYDPVAAKKLLTEAGYPNGFPVKVLLGPKTQGSWLAQGGGEAIGEMLNKNLGIKPEYSSAEYNIFSAACYNGRQDQICIWSGGVGPEPLDWLYAWLYTDGKRNAGHLEDPKIDAMINEANGTLDETERIKKIRDLQNYYYGNVLSLAFLPTGPYYILYSCKLRNYRPAQRPYGGDYTVSVWKATKC